MDQHIHNGHLKSRYISMSTDWWCALYWGATTPLTIAAPVTVTENQTHAANATESPLDPVSTAVE
jgi:hypothetical protein